MQLERPNGRIDGAAFHRGRFYISTLTLSLYMYDLERSPPKRVRSIYLYPPLQDRHGFGRFPGRPAMHVVACDGDLLFAVVYRGRGAAMVVEVHSPDWAAERLELPEKVTDLGEYSLFFGRGVALALTAEEFPAIRRNCIYFVEHDTDYHEEWAVVFDLGSDSLERIPYPVEQRQDGSIHWLAYSWFCPRRPFFKQ